MKTTNKVIIAVMLIAVMLIGVGYAAIQNITLNITGSATANPNDANFSVKFAETTEVSDSTKVTAAVTNDTNATINVTGLTETEYYELKDKMLKSVYQNGGFYVGKYETGIVSNARAYEFVDESSLTTERPIEETAVVQANAYPYNWVRCSQAQTLASGMAAGNYTSSLMFGVQWDLMLKHIEVQAVENGMELATIQSILTKDSKDYGNCLDSEFTITNTSAKYAAVNAETLAISEYASAEQYGKASEEISLLTTGASDSFSLYGIYDIAGNMGEWTLEYTSNSSYPCAFRGSGCAESGSYYPASCRVDYVATGSSPLVAFRPSIF